MKEQSFKLEATGEFPFTFYIEKAEARDENEEMIIEGIASTTNIDHDRERMSKDALRAMESAINNGGVPLRVEHQKEGTAIIGKVFKAWVDERNQLHMKARLDNSHPVSGLLHHSIKSGVKMGLSVGGLVKHAIKEFSESLGGMVKTFYDVDLQEVSVTPRPSNYDSWLIAKSIAKDKEEAELYSENKALREEFLFANSQLDYLQSFAKSIPDKAWRKVESPNINNETINKNMEDKKETTDETTKAVTQSEFKNLANLVSKGFEAVSSLISKAMDTTPKEAVNPDKTKAEEAEQQKAKAMDGDAKDQANPDKKKPEDESASAKAMDTETETTKAMDETETTKAKDDTYDLETVTRSIKSIEQLTKRIKGVKKMTSETDETTKAMDTEETETTKASDETETEKAVDDTEETSKASDDTEETTKNIHPIDMFVVTMTKAMEALTEKMEKTGNRVLGFEKSFVENIRNDKETQEEIKSMMKVPGFKKSVSMNVPYMVTKEGKRFSLISTPEKVEKSENKGKDFKSVYKSDFSSVSNAEE